MNQAPLSVAPVPMAEPLPLELLRPMEPGHQLATPNPPGGEQRAVLLLDDADGHDLEPLPSRVLIGKDGQSRSIWPVHLAGWQALGWQMLSPTQPVLTGPEPVTPDPVEPEPLAPEPEPEAGETTVEPPLDPDPAAGEALLAAEAPDFAAMTKAEIVAFCSASYGVSLDGGMTKAELVEQATVLHASTTEASLLELPDGLL